MREEKGPQQTMGYRGELQGLEVAQGSRSQVAQGSQGLAADKLALAAG
jgi:hypothetical protein